MSFCFFLKNFHLVSLVITEIKIIEAPITNLKVTGSFKSITPNILPNKASKLNIIAVWVDEVYFWATVCIKKAIIELNTAKYNMGNKALESKDIFVPSNINAQIKDNIPVTNNCITDIT